MDPPAAEGADLPAPPPVMPVPSVPVDSTTPPFVAERLASRARLHRALDEAALLLRGERGAVSEHPKVVDAARQSIAGAEAALLAEAPGWCAVQTPPSTVPTMWQRSQAFLKSGATGLERTFADDEQHPAAPAVVLHQVERGDGEALRAAILTDADCALAALAIYPPDQPRAAAAMLLARDTLDVRVGLGGAADSKTTGALDTARAVVSSSSADRSAAMAAVQAAKAAVEAAAARAAFAAALRAVENAKAAADGDRALAGSEPWAWRRLAALEVGLGLESVQKAGAAAPVPSRVLTELGRLSAHLEDAGDEALGTRPTLRSALDALGGPVPRPSPAQPVAEGEVDAAEVPEENITREMSGWWPFGQ